MLSNSPCIIARHVPLHTFQWPWILSNDRYVYSNIDVTVVLHFKSFIFCLFMSKVPGCRPSPCGIPNGRLVSQCRAGAVPGAAPRRASPSVHWPQLLPSGRSSRVPSLPSTDSTPRQGGRSEEGPVLPQQPSGWAYVGVRVHGLSGGGLKVWRCACQVGFQSAKQSGLSQWDNFAFCFLTHSLHLPCFQRQDGRGEWKS